MIFVAVLEKKKRFPYRYWNESWNIVVKKDGGIVGSGLQKKI